MGGESGTSHMGNTYYYYKCGNAKRHGKAHCDQMCIRDSALTAAGEIRPEGRTSARVENKPEEVA